VRLMIFLVSVITVGAFGVSRGVIPAPTQMVRTIVTLGADPAQIKAVNSSPIEAQSQPLPKIIRGSNLEDVGIHGSAVTFPPAISRGMNASPLSARPIAQDAFAANTALQVRQSRMQDLPNYARNPPIWHDPLPH
jgi:hypothetical protein